MHEPNVPLDELVPAGRHEVASTLRQGATCTRRIARVTLLALAALGLFASLALAASVHFKGEQTFTDTGLTLTAAGELAGLGNGDGVITLSAVGDASTVCRNRGGNIAPGQNKVPVLVTATQTVLGEEIKNGPLRIC